MAMPPKKYNPEVGKYIESLAGRGVPVKDISILTDLTDKTLKKYYHKDWLRGRAKANANVGGWLYKKCEEGDVTALIFWAKTQMGWRYDDGKNENENAETLKQLTQAISEAFKSVGN